jgi:type IV secretory pathway VirB9-like protein
MDRRSYYLRLMSNSQDYMARVSFDYPDDDRTKWSSALQKQAQAAKKAQFDNSVKTQRLLQIAARMKGR